MKKLVLFSVFVAAVALTSCGEKKTEAPVVEEAAAVETVVEEAVENAVDSVEVAVEEVVEAVEEAVAE